MNKRRTRRDMQHYALWLVPYIYIVLAMVNGAHAQSQRQTADEKNTAESKQSAHKKVVVTDELSSIQYTTRIVKVPNMSKYAPLRKMPVHDGAPVMVPQRELPILTGEIDVIGDKDDDVVSAGLSDAANRLVQSSTLAPVKTRIVLGSVFHHWVNNRQANRRVGNWQDNDVLVLKGKWDHAERVLQASGIPHLLLSPDKFVDKLLRAKVVVVNCPGEMSNSSLELLQTFVNNGGYLITTDWSLSNCLVPLFHQFVTWDGSYSPSEIVDSVAVEPDNGLFKEAVNRAPWKLDDKSELAKLVNRKRVEVLVRSHMLSEHDPNKLGILALTFAYGKGRVLHLVGHFNNNINLGQQAALPDPSPKIQISLRQALALNFVLEGLASANKI